MTDQETIRPPGAAVRYTPDRQVNHFADELNALERESKILIVRFFISLVLTARSLSGVRQADALRNDIEVAERRELHPGACYARFADGLSTLLSDAWNAADEVPLLLPKPIATVKDWLVINSNTVELDDAHKDL